MTFEEVAKAKVAEMTPPSAQQSHLQKCAQVTGQAITTYAHALRDLEEARSKGEPDMLRYAQAHREAETNLSTAIGAHARAIIASEAAPVANALEPS